MVSSVGTPLLILRDAPLNFLLEELKEVVAFDDLYDHRYAPF